MHHPFNHTVTKPWGPIFYAFNMWKSLNIDIKGIKRDLIIIFGLLIGRYFVCFLHNNGATLGWMPLFFFSLLIRKHSNY